MQHPDQATVPPFFNKYLLLTERKDLQRELSGAADATFQLLQSIPDEKWNYRYAEGKWSIKELVQHVIDTERIFAYRALCIARGETANLPGFDENQYAAASEGDARSKSDLLNELRTVQKSTILLFQSFSESHLAKTGIVNQNRIDVRSIGFMTAGHKLHHNNILRERYL